MNCVYRNIINCIKVTSLTPTNLQVPKTNFVAQVKELLNISGHCSLIKSIP